LPGVLEGMSGSWRAARQNTICREGQFTQAIDGERRFHALTKRFL
jgi:hypothetical protein